MRRLRLWDLFDLWSRLFLSVLLLRLLLFHLRQRLLWDLQLLKILLGQFGRYYR